MHHLEEEGAQGAMNVSPPSLGRWNRPVSRLPRLILTVILFGLVVITPLLWVNANFTYYNKPDNLMDPFTDATTYLAAGERLNVGHDLYRLQAGDRNVLAWPGLYSSPLLSPPPIAVLWRPLASVDWGLAAWVGACWAALLGAMLYVVVRFGLPGVFLAFLLSHPIGEQLAVANANAFMPALYILLWHWRDRRGAGALVALSAAVKLAPIAMIGWLVGTRRWRSIVVAGIALGTLFIIGGLGAGFGSYVEYLQTLPGNKPTPESLSGLTGIPIASYAFLFGCSAAAILVGRRWPRASFVLALLGSVLGTPALYASSLVSLLALAAPFIKAGGGLHFRTPAPPSSSPITSGYLAEST